MRERRWNNALALIGSLIGVLILYDIWGQTPGNGDFNEIRLGSSQCIAWDGTGIFLNQDCDDPPVKDANEPYIEDCQSTDGRVVISDTDGSKCFSTLAYNDATAILTTGGLTCASDSLTLFQSTSPSQTADGACQWDSDDDKICCGTGSSTACFVSGVSAPTTAEYVVAEADATLSAEVAPTAANQVPVSSSSTAAAWGTVPDAALTSNYSGVGACGANTFASTLNDNAAPTCTQPSFSNLSDSAACSQMPALAGDVTSTAGTCTTVAVNLPNGVTQAGHLLLTNIAAPASPAAGKVKTYADSTDLRFHDKNESGVIGTTVVADAGSANNFLQAISTAGVISKAQPGFSNLSGSLGCTQFPVLTGDLTSIGGTCSISVATDAVTYAKMQNVSATDKVLGRTSAGSGDVQEVTFSDSAQDMAADTWADDQTWVATSSTAGAPTTIADSGGATQMLRYTQSTNTFSAGTADATATATTIPARTSNADLVADNFLAGYATTATAAGTTTLGNNDVYWQFFTGTTTQTVKLPGASSVLGQSYHIVNNSTELVTVQSSGANTILALGPRTHAIFTNVSAGGTTAAAWNVEFGNLAQLFTDKTTGHAAGDCDAAEELWRTVTDRSVDTERTVWQCVPTNDAETTFAWMLIARQVF